MTYVMCLKVSQIVSFNYLVRLSETVDSAHLSLLIWVGKDTHGGFLAGD